MELEAIVNQHSGAKKRNEHRRRRKKYLHKSFASSIVAIAFIVATLLKLVKPVLGEVGMMVALMISVYNLGRAEAV